MSVNTSYWEKTSYTIPAQSVITINFSTMPNYWRITNNGMYSVYLGIANIPRPTSYELKIGAGASKVYAEDKGRSEIYLYNEGMDDVNIIIVSFRADFNPLILAMQSDIQVSGGSGGGGGSFDGIITGFTTPLPTGTNKIGNVGISGAIPAGSNVIGKVQLSGNTDDLIGAGNTTLTAINTLIGDIKALLGTVKKYSKVYGRLSSGTATTSGVEVTATSGYQISEVTYITNDGTGALTVAIKQTDGTTQSVTLQAGESLDGFKCLATSITLTGSGVAYRIGYAEIEEV